MSKLREAPRSRRLDVRNLLLLILLVLTLSASFLVLKMYRQRQGRSTLLDEARQRIQRKQTHLALGYVSRYLELNPDDVDALDLKAGLLAESAQTEAEALAAIQAHNQVLGRDPRRQETRRRLIRLTLKVPGRARAAESLARELIARGDDDAEAHRLLTHALELIAADGNVQALAEAVREHQNAERKESGDVEGAERLAFLYAERFNDPTKAQQVLDQMVQADQGSSRKLAQARLARSRYFLARNQPDRAAAEIDQAVQADPTSVAVQMAAAEAATRRGDFTRAREHLDRVPHSSPQNDIQVKLIEGLIELGAQQPEDAIRSWRAGLFLTGGHDTDLTWRLAHILLELGRIQEAEPLVSQYRRLVGGDEPGPRYHYLHGFALLKTNRFAKAIAELEGIRFQLDKSLLPHLYYLLGQCHESARDLPRALEAYRQSANLSPRWNAPWLAIARLQASDFPAEAIATLQRGLALFPRDAELLAALAQVHWRQQVELPREKRSWSEFEQVMTRARNRVSDSPELALIQADYLMATGKAQSALDLLETAARQHPKAVLLWLARASGLNRIGRPARALAVLDQAAAAVGDNADLLIGRASIMTRQGHAKAARALLRAGLDHATDDQKPALLRAEAKLAASHNDHAAACRAYAEWTELRSDDPEPRMALVDLAIATGDETALGAAVAALKKIGGSHSPYWRLARVAELLCAHPSAPPTAARLDEAARLIREIETDHPGMALGFLLEGRLQEKRHETDKAIAAYEHALDLKAGPVAYKPLVALLVREHRSAELERVQARLDSIRPEIARLATIEALRSGDTSRALQLTAQLIQGDPQALDARVWQAKVLCLLGKPEEAEASLERLIAQRPDEPTPWIQLLMFLVAQKRLKEAAATVEQIRTRVKTDRPDLLFAQCYRVAGDPCRASECYQRALEHWPDDVAVRIAAIRFYEETNRKTAAEASLRYLLKRDPELAWAARRLAASLASHTADPAAWREALVLIGPTLRYNDTYDDILVRSIVYSSGPEPSHRRQATEILEDLLASQPRLPAAHLLLAQLRLVSGEMAQAKEHAAEAARGDDVTVFALLLYAGILIKVGAIDEADRQLARLTAIGPDNLPVAELRARILSARGRGAEAAADLENAFTGHITVPENLDAWAKMVHLLLELDQPHAAERLARRLGGIGPRGSCLLAEFLAAQGQPDEAATLLDNVAGSGHTRDAGSSSLAIAQFPGARKHWLERADRYIATAIEAEPNALDLLQQLALVRHLQHRYEDELRLYHTMLTLHPTNYTFLNNMAWTLSEYLNRPEEGLKQADEALERVGWQPRLLDTRGVIETRLSRLDRAIEDLEQAASVLPSATVSFHLARAYQKKGRIAEFHAWRDHARKAGLRPEQLEESDRIEWNSIMNY
jgi:tetratricopeptide (TPR) repeat protein